MNRKIFILCVVLIALLSQISFSQPGVIKDKEVKKQYEKVIKKANESFDNGQYTVAIHFYKKAQKIAPEKKLSKYRLEDIITIFIEKEIASDRTDAKELIEEIEERALKIEASLQDENKDDLEMLLAELDKDIKAKPTVDNRPEEWKRLELDVRNEMNRENGKPEIIENEVVEEKPKKDIDPVLIVEEKPEEIIAEIEKIKPIEKEAEATIPKDTITKLKKELPLIKPVPKKDIKPKRKAYAKLVVEKRVRDKELKEKYKDGKTVEVIEAKSKTTTRTIIKKDGKVNVYLKVKHNWGGEYYFIDNSPVKVQSITKHYYETKVNY